MFMRKMNENDKPWGAHSTDAGYLDEVRKRRRPPSVGDVQTICEWLEACGIRAWLHGGWAVEALAGLALEHNDIDFFVMAAQRARVEECLGRRMVIHKNDFVTAAFQNVQVEFAFLFPYAKDKVYLIHRDVLWLMPHPEISARHGFLGGHPVNIVSPAVVLAEQEHTIRKKKRAIPKMKERAGLLRAVLSDQEIRESLRYWPYPRNSWNMLCLNLRLLHSFGKR